MTTRELIGKLKEMPQDMEVLFVDYEMYGYGIKRVVVDNRFDENEFVIIEGID